MTDDLQALAEGVLRCAWGEPTDAEYILAKGVKTLLTSLEAAEAALVQEREKVKRLVEAAEKVLAGREEVPAPKSFDHVYLVPKNADVRRLEAALAEWKEKP